MRAVQLVALHQLKLVKGHYKIHSLVSHYHNNNRQTDTYTHIVLMIFPHYNQYSIHTLKGGRREQEDYINNSSWPDTFTV